MDVNKVTAVDTVRTQLCFFTCVSMSDLFLKIASHRTHWKESSVTSGGAWGHRW